MNRQQENSLIIAYLIIYAVGLTFFYFNINPFAYICFIAVGIMVFNHIKFVFYMLGKQKNGEI